MCSRVEIRETSTVGQIVGRLSEVQPKTPRIKELKALGLTDSSSKALMLIGETKAKQSFKSFFKGPAGLKNKGKTPRSSRKKETDLNGHSKMPTRFSRQ